MSTAVRRETPRVHQLLAGIVAFPLSVLPFLAYGTLTPEGRLVRDRMVVAVAPPSLPALSAAQRRAVAATAPRYSGGVMSLVYHGLGSASDGEGGTVLSPRGFGEHLVALRAAGMHTVTARDVADAFARQRPLPPRAVMISFDDGRNDAMLFADPLLAEAKMKATMFVITGAASKPGVYYAGWDRLEAAARSGRWDLESHTSNSHDEQEVRGGKSLPLLTSVAPGESLAEYRSRVRADLAAASAAVATHTGRRPVAFAYPFGAYGADRTNAEALRAVLREEVARQYAVAFQQDDQETVPLATADQARLELRRLEVGNWSGVGLLRRIAAAAARTPGMTPEPAERSGTTISVDPPEDLVPEPGALGVPPQVAPPTSIPRSPLPTVDRPVAPPAVVPPVVTTPPAPSVSAPSTTIRPPAPPSTTTTTPVPPTTVPPDNCGGQTHGNPCRHRNR